MESGSYQALTLEYVYLYYTVHMFVGVVILGKELDVKGSCRENKDILQTMT